MATPSPARLKVKRCPKCGETDLSKFTLCKWNKSGYSCWCLACKKLLRGGRLVEVACTYCEKLFSVTKGHYNRRMKQNQAGRMYCSKLCSSLHKREGSPGNVARFKRRSWWSDERWYWERKLVEVGLGMDIGISRYIEYGLEPGRGWDSTHNEYKQK